MKLNMESRNFRLFSPDENNSNRWQDAMEVTNRAWMAERYPYDDHLAPDGQGDGNAQRTPVPGMAGRIPVNRPARVFFLLRGVYPHHRLDVQSACEVAEGVPRNTLAAPNRLAQLSLVVPRLAAGSQRIQPPGPWVHRSRCKQESRGRSRLSSAGREHAPFCDRSLPAQPQLCQRRGRRQTAGPSVVDDGPGGQTLHGWHRNLGMGEQ